MSKIEWTEQTWNPIIGCSKVSPGCKNCYAETMAVRLKSIESTNSYNNVIDVNKWNSKTHFIEHQLNKPLRRKKPTMFFVCSMSDLFHENTPYEWIDEVFDIMEKATQHTFQVLTKRPQRMLDYMIRYGIGTFPENIWLGVTAENQEQANKRIPILLEIPAKVRFVSIEPMLSFVDLENIKGNAGSYYQVLQPVKNIRPALDWVICGGESGPNARPMHPDWVRSLRDQCQAANVLFFFKQWGEWKPTSAIDLNEGVTVEGSYWPLYWKKTGKKKAGSRLDGQEYKQMPPWTR